MVKSVEKIAKEALKNTSNILFDSKDDIGPNNIGLLALSTPLLKLKIRNTTQYLTWRLSILKGDNFTCPICHDSIKENKSLGLEVHHAKSFDDICKQNNASTVEQALQCKELWKVNNGISICYRCYSPVTNYALRLQI